MTTFGLWALQLTVACRCLDRLIQLAGQQTDPIWGPDRIGGRLDANRAEHANQAGAGVWF